MTELNLQKRDKPTDIEAIRAWYFSEEEVGLTDHQEAKRVRLLLVQSLMAKGRSQKEIVSVLEKDHSVSNATAYRDCRDAVKLYGEMRKAEKEGVRWILYEIQMKALRWAAKNKDLKQYNAAVANLIKITGVDKEDVDMPDFEKLEASTIIAVLPEGMHEFFRDKMRKGPLDLNQIAEEIEYEEVNNKDSGGGDPGGD